MNRGKGGGGTSEVLAKDEVFGLQELLFVGGIFDDELACVEGLLLDVGGGFGLDAVASLGGLPCV